MDSKLFIPSSNLQLVLFQILCTLNIALTFVNKKIYIFINCKVKEKYKVSYWYFSNIKTSI